MSDSDASHRGLPSAGRMRTHRERRRNGLLVVPLHVRTSEIDALVRRGLLAHAMRSDRWAIACAVGRLLESYAGIWVTGRSGGALV